MRWIIIASVMALASCGQNVNNPAFDGKNFRAKLSKVDKQRNQFSIAVSPVSQSLEGAREAGRYEATKYCIAQYGSSRVNWINGPDGEEGALSVIDDKLQLRGACNL